MSDHLDTPLAGQNGQLYIDDLYVFPADGSTLFVMDVNATITRPHPSPTLSTSTYHSSESSTPQ